MNKNDYTTVTLPRATGKEENFVFVGLNGKGWRILRGVPVRVPRPVAQILAESLLSVGNVNLSLISPRTLFLEALKNHAVNVILLHNHPSGDPTPSRTDRDLTSRLYGLCRMMEIPLLDHIIIGDQKYYSFQEHGALDRDPKIPGSAQAS